MCKCTHTLEIHTHQENAPTMNTNLYEEPPPPPKRNKDGMKKVVDIQGEKSKRSKTEIFLYPPFWHMISM